MDDPIQAQLIAARRNQILDAAQRVFAAQGFHGATVRDVARAAGVADGTIYNYFANKTDLLFGLLNRLNQTEQRAEHFARAGAQPSADFFPTYLRQRMEMLWPHAGVFQAVLPEMLANPALRERYFQQVIAPTMAIGEAYIQGLVAQGAIPDVDGPLLVRSLAGMVLGLLVLQLLGDPYLPDHWQDVPAVVAALMTPGLRPSTGDQHESQPPAEPGESAL